MQLHILEDHAQRNIPTARMSNNGQTAWRYGQCLLTIGNVQPWGGSICWWWWAAIAGIGGWKTGM